MPRTFIAASTPFIRRGAEPPHQRRDDARPRARRESPGAAPPAFRDLGRPDARLRLRLARQLGEQRAPVLGRLHLRNDAVEEDRLHLLRPALARAHAAPSLQPFAELAMLRLGS